MRALFVCAVTLLGCSVPNSNVLDADGGPDGGQAEALAALQSATGHTWRIRNRTDVGTPAWLIGCTAPLALTPDDAEHASRTFLQQNRALYSLSSVDDLITQSSEIDSLNQLHVRFTHEYQKIPVWGDELRVTFDVHGELTTIGGRYTPITALPTIPEIASAHAQTVAIASAQAANPQVAAALLTALVPSLWIYNSHLTFRVEVTVADLLRPARTAIFVDAIDGSVIDAFDEWPHLQGSGLGVLGDPEQFQIANRGGVDYLEDATRGTPGQKTYSLANRTRLPGVEVQSANPNQWDQSGPGAGSAVDATAYVDRAFDYFSGVHGWRGWDGLGGSIEITVHFGSRYADAFFDGRGLVFGDGDDQAKPLAGAADIVAHEFSHAVIEAQIALGKTGQSGALGEALADLFATFITYDGWPQGRWLIGASVFASGPLRDLAEPYLTKDATTLDQYDPQQSVYYNSTIVSHVGYLMADGSGGLGVTAAAQIWYRALRYYLTATSDLTDAADATIAAAGDLNAGWVAPVQAAWTAAGIEP